VTDGLVMCVARAADGRWRVVGDDGSICEDGFSTAAAAQRWIEDRSDLADGEVRALVERCSPAQRRELRRLVNRPPRPVPLC
jgi:hypothetical protein